MNRPAVLSGLAIILGLAVAPVTAERVALRTGTALETLADRVFKDSETPAIAIGIWEEGQGTKMVFRGVRTKGGDSPVSATDRWHLGSLTKSMTALLFARLAERGIVDWDAPLSIGEVVTKVTPRDVIAHRAGLPENASSATLRSLRGAAQDRDLQADRRLYSASILASSPDRRPSGFRYSNAGYVLLGTAMEAATAQGWEELMIQEVFAPLGLSSAGFGPPIGAAGKQNAEGHRRLVLGLGPLRPVGTGPDADNVPAMGPAGTVHMSLPDLMRYLSVHAQRNPQFLTSASWDRLHKPQPWSDYAGGWVILPDGGLIHDGSNTFWYVLAAVWPATDGKTARAAAVLANSGEIDHLAPIFSATLMELAP